MEKKENVFVINEQWNVKGEETQQNIGVYKNIEDAKKRFDLAVERIKKDWDIDELSDDDNADWIIEDETDRLLEFHSDDYDYYYTIIIEEHTLL